MGKQKTPKVETFEGYILEIRSDGDAPGLCQGSVLFRPDDPKRGYYRAFLKDDDFRTAWRAFEDCKPIRVKGRANLVRTETSVGFIEGVEKYDPLERRETPENKESEGQEDEEKRNEDL